MNDKTEDVNDTAGVRRMAVERMGHLARLQFRRRRRGPVDKPWRDPRQGQGRVLALLRMKPEMTQRELTFLMGMSRQSLAELLGKLERQGLIARTPSDEDRRVVNVSLTPAGQAAEQRTDMAGSGDGLLDCLNDDEVAQFNDYLGRVIQQVEQGMGEAYEERRAKLERYWAERGGEPDGWSPEDGRFGPAWPGMDEGFGPDRPGADEGFGPDRRPGMDERFGPHPRPGMEERPRGHRGGRGGRGGRGSRHRGDFPGFGPGPRPMGFGPARRPGGPRPEDFGPEPF